MRTAFITSLEARIRDLDGKMEAAADKVRKSGAADMLENQKQYYYYKALRSELLDKIAQARSGTDEDWDAHKAALETVYNEMAGYFDSIYSQYGDETGLF
ncbi:MAG: hypothetical protein AB1916_04725 [Thermodesulfobacteriota bacterium]